ncbi:transporter [Streptomyces sp. SM10]|uniref:transporter n=1 Tax=Streptomyces sp. SM10 TaxID=565556 RepID=UPI0021561128|nr:transporter [Streptomyces sp. SM10]
MPLVARELEAGTHRLVWNQGVTRTRWLLTRLALSGLIAMAASGLLSLAVSWWADPIDQAVATGGSDNGDNFVPRIDPATFPIRGIAPPGLRRIRGIAPPGLRRIRGIAPLAYAAFAFVLGVTLGVIIRRTLPAMAATLATYTTVQLVVPMWVREHLAPTTTVTAPFTPDRLANYALDSVSHVEFGKPEVGVTAEHTLDGTGLPAHGMPPGYADCESIKECVSSLTSAGYQQRITYQPANNFWTLQWAEAGVYLALAIGLGALCVWWTRKRLS